MDFRTRQVHIRTTVLHTVLTIYYIQVHIRLANVAYAEQVHSCLRQILRENEDMQPTKTNRVTSGQIAVLMPGTYNVVGTPCISPQLGALLGSSSNSYVYATPCATQAEGIFASLVIASAKLKTMTKYCACSLA
jgi:cytochrome c biogenesis protein CcdA